VNPAARIYDPAFAYEIAVIVEEAVRRVLGPEPEDRFWYITLYNENYTMPALPEGPAGEETRAAILRGLYRFAEPLELSANGPEQGHGRSHQRGNTPDAGSRGGGTRRATLLFSGPMWQVAMQARDLLAADWGVSCDTWSATSYSKLRVDALSVERWNRLHPGELARVPFVTGALANGPEDAGGPVVAVSDYLRAVPDQISRWVRRPFISLGTDGFGRSDTRAALRRFFEVDAAHVVVAVLSGLAQAGQAKPDEVADAISRYGIDPSTGDPWAT
jgi:pyruvate dehydrogenase E1 component